MRNIKLATKIKALALTVAMSLSAFSMNVSAAEPADEVSEPTITITKISDNILTDTEPLSVNSNYYVDRSGAIANGSYISGTFSLPNLFGNNFTVMAGARTVNGGNGTVYLSLASALYSIPCNEGARVLARETGWSSGTYSYSISNNTGDTVAYALKIYKP